MSLAAEHPVDAHHTPAPGRAAEPLALASSLQQALKHDAHFRTLFEGVPIGISVAGDGVTVAVNPAYLRMFGYAAAEAVIGQPLLRDIAPQEQPRIAERARQREQGVAVPNAYETVGQRADGSQFPFLAEVARVTFDSDPVSLAFFTDITARKQAERLVEEQRGRALAQARPSQHAGLPAVGAAPERLAVRVGRGRAQRREPRALSLRHSSAHQRQVR